MSSIERAVSARASNKDIFWEMYLEQQNLYR